ncbi:unnamed protein product [Penicillium nalgiovense]|uniref:Uncharacterized protein n=1 Tax=Penicillium nalgiovense TaxID=60175 RepID=A0A9W4HQY7_PENNA|nr:unnamed protein product [Penicillium nalgiovense]CAG8051290.1 unnamed protein product [Penicillium nalgiovense]CAG8059551.1 unnamed protein product [Penicillium nalgiovense]CAG8059975.1 unnamed protein product [Penicillium nalgiovense]CAG8067008.1 unnamed protein product [Penicillium nalgiovense]
MYKLTLTAFSLNPFADIDLWRNHLINLPHSLVDPSEQMMRSLFEGYRPTFKPHSLGYEAESLLLLTPSQQMCYYDGKLFGG